MAQIKEIDIRDFLRHSQSRGEKMSRKEAIAAFEDLIEHGIMKIIKKYDKNRYLVEVNEPDNPEGLLPGFEESRYEE